MWIPPKRRGVSVRDVIFDEEELWDGKPITHTDKNTREMDKIIERIEVQSGAMEMEDIQLGEDLEVQSTPARTWPV